MKILLLVLFVVVGTCLTIVHGDQKRFDNYKVFTIKAKTEAQVQAIIELQASANNEYSLWNEIGLKKPIDLLVSPLKQNEFLDFAKKYNLENNIKIENVQTLIDLESSGKNARNGFGWESYYELHEINAFLDDLLIRYPNVLTEHLVGTSYHGTPIRGVKISHKTGNPAILVESTIHAREWITAATGTYILNELLTSDDPTVMEIASNIDWYFIPVLNPDGFNYTKTTNRMWRKTRYPHSHLCYGVDLNRNFDFQWMHVGASQNPCSETYAGPRAFSDPESRALADFFEARKDDIKVFIALHSYGQYILTPFGYTKDKANNYEGLMQVGNAGAAAIAQRYGTQYTVGSTADVLYMNSGSSRDWLKGVHNLNISYTMELRDTGSYGFILPPAQILPTALETFDGFKAMVAECRVLGYL